MFEKRDAYNAQLRQDDPSWAARQGEQYRMSREDQEKRRVLDARAMYDFAPPSSYFSHEGPSNL